MFLAATAASPNSPQGAPLSRSFSRNSRLTLGLSAAKASSLELAKVRGTGLWKESEEFPQKRLGRRTSRTHWTASHLPEAQAASRN